ncbi:integrase [Sorangium sp. So ce1097]|uniref:integrase n=1 Tax=Sorangium sp. So ce1097 TaxID=3133330 RepID=UPI003F610152
MDHTEATRRSAELHHLLDAVLPELTESTRRQVSARWRRFTAWCAARGSLALPARPRAVLLHLLAMERERAATEAIDEALCAIRTAHDLMHHASPTDSAVVRRWLEGRERTSTREDGLLDPAQVRRILHAMGDVRLADVRDRALVLLGYVGRLQPADLAVVDVDDLVLAKAGLELRLRGQPMPIPFGRSERTCAVRALTTWTSRARLVTGPLFVAIDAQDRPGERLSGEAVAALVRDRARRAGITVT